MKTRILLLALVLTACTTQNNQLAVEEAPLDFFTGAWALDLGYENNKSGWLEIRQEEGYLDADLLWRWGSVHPVEFVFYNSNHIFITEGRSIVRERDEEGNPLRTQHYMSWMAIRKGGENTIEGIASFPSTDGSSVEEIKFTGKRIPEAESKPDLSGITYGESIDLLAESDLSNWELLGGFGENGWSLNDGVLLNNPVQKEGEEHIAYGNLRTVDEFEDFTLNLEVNVPEGSNSGVYLRGIYEIQVSDSYGLDLDSHNMGALYSRITPLLSAEKPAGEWQSLEITLYKRYLTVILNGQVIIDNEAVKGITGGAMRSDEFIPGPIYLQGDHGKVMYRNIQLKPIK